MSVESIIFFLLALFVWGLSVVGRWLQAQMQKQSTDGIEFEPIEWSPQPEDKKVSSVSRVEAVAPREEPQQKSSPTIPSSKIIRHKKTIRHLGLGSPRTIRQGIILMTVLGPCRALEKPDEFMRT